MSNPTYLCRNRFGTYYFRLVIPPHLRRAFSTQKREVRRSLGTSNRGEALCLARFLWCALFVNGDERLFESLLQERAGAREVLKKRSDCFAAIFSRALPPHSMQNQWGSDGLGTAAPFDALPSRRSTATNGVGNAKGDPVRVLEARASSDPTPLFSELVEEYAKEQNTAGNWRPKTDTENRFIFTLFKDVVGDKRLGQVTREDVNHFRKAVMELPPNFRKDPRYRDLSISEVLAQPDRQRMSPLNIKKYLTRIGTIFRYAHGRGYLKEDVTVGIGFKVKHSAGKKRAGFSAHELEALLLSDEYLRQNGASHRRAHCFWLPFLGAFTGARLNELCQLHLDDFSRRGEAWMMSINENAPDKRLKNNASERVIPVHPVLVRLGLPNYIERLKNRGESRLFPELRSCRDGYGQNASKWFADYRKRCGVSARGKDFHSFRHTVANHLKQKSVAESKAKAFLGHSEDSMTFGTYAEAYDPRALIEVANAIDYGITLDPLFDPEINPYLEAC